MSTALLNATTALHVRLTGITVWGVCGRTLSQRAEHPDEGACWLRLHALPTAEASAGGRLWTGAEDAARLDGKVNKPRLVAIHDSHCDHLALRAELSEYVTEPVGSPDPVLRTELTVTSMWWTSLHTDLATIAAMPTERRAVRQEWVDRAVPRYTGRPAPRITWWTNAHADLHPSNITHQTLVILDWEGHGLAPAGYGLAMFLAHCLLAPSTAERIRDEFVDLLDTESGRQVQLVVAAELLQSAERGWHTELVAPLQRMVQDLF